MTRTVQARQKGRCIFTTTCSFMREGSEGAKAVAHGWDIPDGVIDLLPDDKRENRAEEGEGNDEGEDAEGNGVQRMGPFVSRRLGVVNSECPPFSFNYPQTMKDFRIRGKEILMTCDWGAR